MDVERRRGQGAHVEAVGGPGSAGRSPAAARASSPGEVVPGGDLRGAGGGDPGVQRRRSRPSRGMTAARISRRACAALRAAPP